MPISALSSTDFHKRLTKTRTAIVPLGSLEQHGPHLPLSTDSLISERIAALVAEQLRCFVLPSVSFGVSFEHLPMFNVSLRDSTLSEILQDICVSLSAQGINLIIFINAHHGNSGVLQYVSQNLASEVRLNTRIYSIDYWSALRNGIDHAGEMETSLILAISPDMVRIKDARPNSKKLSKSRLAYSVMTRSPGSFPRITGNGVWGDPRRATKEKGHRLLKEIVTNLIQIISELQM